MSKEPTEDEKMILAELNLLSFHLPPPSLGESILTTNQKQARQLSEALTDILENGTDEKKHEVAEMIFKKRTGC